MGRGALFASLMSSVGGGDNTNKPVPPQANEESHSTSSDSNTLKPARGGRGRGLLLATLNQQQG